MEKKQCLNGEWQFTPIYENSFNIYDADKISALPFSEKILVPSSWKALTVVAKYGFDSFDCFEYPKKWNDASFGAYRRTIYIEKEPSIASYIIEFKAVAKKSTLFINGKFAADNEDLYLPFICDITEFLTEGENTIELACAEFGKVQIPSGEIRVANLVGSGMNACTCLGIWQDAFLYSLPHTYIEDAEIVTSVRNESISLFLSISGDISENADVTAEIFDGTDMVKSLHGTSRGSFLELTEKWTDAIFWDCENPHLYTMKINLTTPASRHIKEIRFGFRELWAEGDRFMLNGVRINLRGDSWHFLGARQMTKEYAKNWCRLCRERGLNSIRYHANPHPDYYLDAADEEGILIIDETAIYGSGKTMDAAHPHYIECCKDHIKRFVKRDKNHASVVIWSLQNEMRWVDGRDEFKKHEVELMQLFHACDRSSRLVSLDGDNRLLDKKDTEIASLHYNIDGMIKQWDRKVPLTIGEHGGLWYICPQNSSMYMGLDAYGDHDKCAEGISEKELLFMEYARREYVSGISSFNYANYFATAMPKEDVILPADDITAPGVHPKRIKKYSLTVNNGMLNDYPAYIENPICHYANDGLRAVTVIAREYNRSFYNGKIKRAFDIYNDTLKSHNVDVFFKASLNGKTILSQSFNFIQEPAIYKTLTVEFDSGAVSKKSNITLSVELYHEGKLMHTLVKNYNIYPTPVKITDEKIAYFGKNGFEAVKALCPSLVPYCKNTDARLLIIAPDIRMSEDFMHPIISSFIKKGGRVLILEQDEYSFASMTISKKRFLRAHASEYSHPIFNGLCNDDFKQWLEGEDEYGPDTFIVSAFEKPTACGYRILLECSYGDFNDGGDLWSPMLEYSTNGGGLIATQLPYLKFLDNVPMAYILLSNTVNYLLNVNYSKKKLFPILNDADKDFADSLGLSYAECMDDADVIIASAELACNMDFTNKKVLVMPTSNENALSKLVGGSAKIEKADIYALTSDYSDASMKCVSRVDMFGCDLPVMCPRDVENRPVAKAAVSVEGGRTLAEGREDIVWQDLMIEHSCAEHYKRALVEFKKDFEKPLKSVIAAKDNFIISEFVADKNYDKSRRVYSTILTNLGIEVGVGELDVIKGEERFSLEAVMALPLLPHQDFNRAFEYYSDPEFSLNNLGEGLYGWLKKYERSEVDGFFNFKGMANKTMFIISFVHQNSLPAKKYRIIAKANSTFSLYVNGKKVTDGIAELKQGVNPIFILQKCNEADGRLYIRYANEDGSPAKDLIYRTTVDEVDPK